MTGNTIRFDDRAVLITGAGRGLGRTHALLLAARGARVIVADNGVSIDGDGQDAGPAAAVVEEIRAAGGTAVACTADLATEAGSQEAVARAIEAFGRIDGLIHGATTVPALVPAAELSTDAIDKVMRVNAYAGLWLARAAWPWMQQRKYGRIVYTTSAGIYGAEFNAPYAAAKAACIGIARCLAAEGERDGIMVNVIAPSARTRTTEGFLQSAYAQWLFRTMPPEKVSVGAAWLVSEQCTITGEILALGGGRIGRVTLAETDGVMGSGESIEEVDAMMSDVMADVRTFSPRNLAERSEKVSSLFGFKG